MTPAAQLLMTVAEDLRKSDPATYAALTEGAHNGATTIIQFTCGPEATIAVGLRDDYGSLRWLHTCPL
jgi:hypothetical protein